MSTIYQITVQFFAIVIFAIHLYKYIYIFTVCRRLRTYQGGLIQEKSSAGW